MGVTSSFMRGYRARQGYTLCGVAPEDIAAFAVGGLYSVASVENFPIATITATTHHNLIPSQFHPGTLQGVTA